MLTFSERYLRPAVIQDDSPRMRVQLLALFERVVGRDLKLTVRNVVRERTGAEVPWGTSGLDWERFFKQGDLRDVLDIITATHLVLRTQPHTDRYQPSKNWLTGVERIFDTQNAKYRVDETGSVLLRVDEQFESDRTATLAGLNDPRYQGVRAEFDGAYHALAAEHPNGKQAIRGVFEACEVVFKLMFPTAQRLAGPQLGQFLTPFVAQHYAADIPAQKATEKLVQGFTDWVAAAQFYRHGQGQEEPNQPPLEVAVMILSSGASYLRWLVHLDQAKLAAEQ